MMGGMVSGYSPPATVSASAPTVNDDSTEGYAIGAHWVDSSTDTAYTLLDDTAGAAVWAASTFLGTSGIATLDFGTGAMLASVTVIGIGTTTASTVVSAQMRIEATADHTVDDLLIDPIRVESHSIVAGVGFTIVGHALNSPMNGTYNIGWSIS
jgi:hypothetical protein